MLLGGVRQGNEARPMIAGSTRIHGEAGIRTADANPPLPRAAAAETRTSLVQRLEESRPLAHLVSAGIFALATLASIFAQQAERPITAAIIYLFGVTLVAGIEGMRGGLLAAVTASLVYNFFISTPVFRFSLISAEHYVPVIAFNLSAAASALLAGRLRDRAAAAERATRQMQMLLEASHMLQSAVHVDQISAATSEFFRTKGRDAPELYAERAGKLAAVSPSSRKMQIARRLLLTGEPSLEKGWDQAFLLSTGAGPVGALVLSEAPGTPRTFSENELRAFLNLLSIALERCLLLEQLSEAELIKRSEEFKTTLLSSVSHDMRTPLGAISASASSLSGYWADLAEPVRLDLLRTIQEQCDRLDRYTRNLLNLGRLQSGLDPQQFVECDALEVLGTATSRVRSAAKDREIAKCYSISSALVNADPVMLEQVFFNVLDNAVRYSPADSIVSIFADIDQGHLAVRIADRGEGIPAEDLEQVFNRFFRSRTSISKEGSGLGLSIAKGFTEAFGGTIAATQAEGGGTEIAIRLPLQAGEAGR